MIVDATQKPPGEALPINRGIYHGLLNKFWRISTMPKRTFSKDDIRKFAKEENVRYLRLQFTDILGTIKNVEVPVSQLEKVLDNEMMFDGSSIEGLYVSKNLTCIYAQI